MMRRALGALAGSWLLALLVVCLPAPSQARTDWRTLRDAGIERQGLDFSCGAAALATLLQWYGLDNVDEAALLEAHYARLGHPLVAAQDAVDIAQWYLSMADLSALAARWGLRAHGVGVAPERLWDLQLPAIAHLAGRERRHFVVIQGLDANRRRVAIADPASGHRYVSAAEFFSEWLSAEAVDTAGRLLLLEPGDSTRDRALRQRFSTHHWRDAPVQYLLPALR
jgi:predicted double-glycine peptidase